MSVDATNWAWERNGTIPQKLVLLALADTANETHESILNIPKLVVETGLDQDVILATLFQLERRGDIRYIFTNGSKREKKYQLLGVQDRNTVCPGKNNKPLVDPQLQLREVYP